jgi:NitT/TauT family transport system permease protein
LGRIVPLVVLAVLWEAVGRAVGSRLLPPLTAVLAALGQGLWNGALARDLGVTLLRVALAFVLAMGAGAALGITMGRSRRLDAAFDSLLTLLLNLPALVVIVLLFVWFGMNEVTTIVAVALNKLPGTAVTLREGARALDPGLAGMARVFGMSRLATLRHVVLPQLGPYLIAAARSGLAVVWKIVLVAELLGRSDGIGFRLQVDFQLFDVTAILADTLALLIAVQAIEWLALQPVERALGRWRQ